MNEKIRQKLCELIAQYGFSLCNDQKRCEILLENHYGQSNKDVFILIAALKNRVVEDLINASPSALKYALYKRLINRLENDLGLKKQTAQWAVESWALALGVLEKPIFTSTEKSHLFSKISEAREEIKVIYPQKNRNLFYLKIAGILLFMLIFLIFGWRYNLEKNNQLLHIIEENNRLSRQESQQKIQEMQRLAEEAAQRKIQEAQRLADQEAQRKIQEAQRLVEQEAQRKIQEAQRLADQETQRLVEQEAQRKIQAAQRLADQEAQRLAEQEAQRRIQAAQRLAEQEAQRKIQEAQRLAEQEAQRLAEQEAQRKIQEAQRLAEQVAQRLAEQVAQRLVEQEAQRRIQAAQRLAEQEAQRKIQEAQRLAEQETQRSLPDPLVIEIQKKLLHLGYLSGKADGHAGQKTLNAIKQFQQENSLSIDLEISEKLLSNLNLGEPRVSRQVPQNQVQNRQKSKPDIRNQDTNRNQDECIKIKREMDVYSSRVNQKDIDAIVKYDQLYKKYQKTCRNFW